MWLSNYYFGVYPLTYITTRQTMGTNNEKVAENISNRYQYGEGES
jgi:hypothetical protein